MLGEEEKMLEQLTYETSYDLEGMLQFRLFFTDLIVEVEEVVSPYQFPCYAASYMDIILCYCLNWVA